MLPTLTAAMVKEQAKAIGADLCGIASMDRFEGTPAQFDPRYIFPNAKSCIVLGFRIPRGYFRGIEEGTYFASYAGMGYGNINRIVSPLSLRYLCCYIEDFGWEAAPVPNLFLGNAVKFNTQKQAPEYSVPVRDGLPQPDILVDYRVCAYLAGMGQIGYSKVFLTPEFGPFQRFVILLTDAPLDPDPIFEGTLCDRCMRCAKACTGGAISTTETESITVAGHKIEWGKLDVLKCSTAYMGANKEYNPFLPEGTPSPEELSKTYHGYHHKINWTGYGSADGNNPPIEGARGCMRECYAHLEQRGVLTRSFHNPFREKGQKQWKITDEWREEYKRRIKADVTGVKDNDE